MLRRLFARAPRRQPAPKPKDARQLAKECLDLTSQIHEACDRRQTKRPPEPVTNGHEK